MSGRRNHDVKFRAGQRHDNSLWYTHQNVDRITENELFLTALVGAEMALKRKNTILQAMDSLDAAGMFDEGHAVPDQARTSMQTHLNWLLDSLDEANESYKHAKEYVEHLGEMPKGRTTNSATCKNETRDVPAYFCESLADSHAARLLLHSSSASRASVTRLLAGGDITKEMEEIMYRVGQLLLIPAVHNGEKITLLEAHVGKALQTAVSAVLVSLCQSVVSPDETPDVGSFETHLYQNALKDREEAIESLKEAVDLLNIEFMECDRRS